MACAKVDINVYGYQEGENPDLMYGWIISTRDSAHGPALITRRVWIELPNGVKVDEPVYNGVVMHSVWDICRKGYDCHDGRGNTCQPNIKGNVATNPGYVGIRLPGNDVDAVKAKIDGALIAEGLTLSMPTAERGKREMVSVKVIKDDGYLDYLPL